MIISTDTKKVFDKIQHLFTILKKNRKLGLEENFLNLIKGFCEKSMANIILSGERSDACP